MGLQTYPANGTVRTLLFCHLSFLRSIQVFVMNDLLMTLKLREHAAGHADALLGWAEARPKPKV